MIEKLISHTRMPLTFSFEDNGVTAYGYLHGEDGKVLADVWLYNRADTPAAAEWDDPARMPFRNCREFTRPDAPYNLPTTEAEIDVGWTTNAAGKPGVVVLLNGKPIGELCAGDMPGRSLMAAKDGPLARCISEVPPYRRMPTTMEVPAEFLNEYERNLVANIKKHGWFCNSVQAGKDGPAFTYSIGFWLTLGIPEVIVFSLPPNTAHGVLWDLFRNSQKGTTVPSRQPVPGVFGSADAAFIPVTADNFARHLLSARWLYGRDDVPCLQLLWPDTKGAFPWQTGFEKRFAKDQPDLSAGNWAGGFLH